MKLLRASIYIGLLCFGLFFYGALTGGGLVDAFRGVPLAAGCCACGAVGVLAWSPAATWPSVRLVRGPDVDS